MFIHLICPSITSQGCVQETLRYEEMRGKGGRVNSPLKKNDHNPHPCLRNRWFATYSYANNIRCLPPIHPHKGKILPPRLLWLVQMCVSLATCSNISWDVPQDQQSAQAGIIWCDLAILLHFKNLAVDNIWSSALIRPALSFCSENKGESCWGRNELRQTVCCYIKTACLTSKQKNVSSKDFRRQEQFWKRQTEGRGGYYFLVGAKSLWLLSYL